MQLVYVELPERPPACQGGIATGVPVAIFVDFQRFLDSCRLPSWPNLCQFDAERRLSEKVAKIRKNLPEFTQENLRGGNVAPPPTTWFGAPLVP